MSHRDGKNFTKDNELSRGRLPRPTIVDSQISVKVKENGQRLPLNFV
jgi:hypothetical protein